MSNRPRRRSNSLAEIKVPSITAGLHSTGTSELEDIKISPSELGFSSYTSSSSTGGPAGSFVPSLPTILHSPYSGSGASTPVYLSRTPSFASSIGERGPDKTPPILPISRPYTPDSRSRSFSIESGSISSRHSRSSSEDSSLKRNPKEYLRKQLTKIFSSSSSSSSLDGFNPVQMNDIHWSSATYEKSTCYNPYTKNRSDGRRSRLAQVKRFCNLLSRPKRMTTLIIMFGLIFYLFSGPLIHFYKSNRFLGGGSKFVIVLASNEDGGVLKWKGAKEWEIERLSVQNKKDYARRHGYTLDIKDMKASKRYAHEWRESWEKIDVIRSAMKKYPKAEWFWYMDLNTFIMEPKVSLQKHIFDRIGKVTYRDINIYNPLNITHPPEHAWLDPITRSKVGDGKPESINVLVPQDCGGFNLGSFMIRRSEFTKRLMDVWWDPVSYEQRHSVWEHKEQNVLEHLYKNQPWTRNGIAFIPQRMVNSFPPGACSQMKGDRRIFYDYRDRDFVVNMAGCEWGRDCLGEMKYYKKIREMYHPGSTK